MPSVLFVCTANQFRSPMAAACFEQLLTEREGQGEWEIRSAGIWATEGQPAPPEAVAAAKGRGLNLENHRSQMINGQLLRQADLIVVMTRGQQEALRVEFPEVSSRIHLLSELSGGLPGDVPDPPSAPTQISRIMHEVSELVVLGFPRIRQLARDYAESRR